MSFLLCPCSEPKFVIPLLDTGRDQALAVQERVRAILARPALEGMPGTYGYESGVRGRNL